MSINHVLPAALASLIMIAFACPSSPCQIVVSASSSHWMQVMSPDCGDGGTDVSPGVAITAICTEVTASSSGFASTAFTSSILKSQGWKLAACEDQIELWQYTPPETQGGEPPPDTPVPSPAAAMVGTIALDTMVMTTLNQAAGYSLLEGHMSCNIAPSISIVRSHRVRNFIGGTTQNFYNSSSQLLPVPGFATSGPSSSIVPLLSASTSGSSATTTFMVTLSTGADTAGYAQAVPFLGDSRVDISCGSGIGISVGATLTE